MLIALRAHGPESPEFQRTVSIGNTLGRLEGRV
jgi:hypothetical protein